MKGALRQTGEETASTQKGQLGSLTLARGSQESGPVDTTDDEARRMFARFWLPVCAGLLVIALAGCSAGAPVREPNRERASEPRSSRGGLAYSPWPRAGHDNGRTNQSELLGPTRPAVKSERPYPGSPVVAPDGALYIGSKSGLVALAANGKKKWEHRLKPGRFNAGAPSVARDGTVYSGVFASGAVVALLPNGTKKWELKMESATEGAPLIGADGTIYSVNSLGCIYAIRPSGRQRWVFAARRGAEWRKTKGSRPSAGIMAAPDGTIYLAVDGPRLYAVSQDGKELWSLGPNVFFGRDPTVEKATQGDADLWPEGTSASEISVFPLMTGPDGTAYVAAATSTWEQSRLCAIDTKGQVKWVQDRVGGATVSLALGLDGTLCAADDAGYLTSLDPSNGRRRWRVSFAPEALILAGPSVDGSGTIYVGCESTGRHPGRLYAYRPSGKRTWELKLDYEPSGEIVIGPNRTLYVSFLRRVGRGWDDFRTYSLAIGEK